MGRPCPSHNEQGGEGISPGGGAGQARVRAGHDRQRVGYNGSTPGPTIEAVEGDRVRIYVTNKLPERTSVHWHGILLPNGMDGVAGLNQPHIEPGETYVYEFTLKQTRRQHVPSHSDEMVQMALGMMGFFVIHPKVPETPKIDRHFVSCCTSGSSSRDRYAQTECHDRLQSLYVQTVESGPEPIPGSSRRASAFVSRSEISAWTVTPSTCTATTSSRLVPTGATVPSRLSVRRPL